MPGDRDDDSKSPPKRVKTEVVDVKVFATKKERPSNAAFQALVKTCRDSDNDDDGVIEEKSIHEIEACHEVDVPNVSAADQYEEEHYDALADSYFQNDSITLKVINDQMGKWVSAAIVMKAEAFGHRTQ